MTDTVIARRYANALFTIGKKSGNEDLENFAGSLTDLSVALNASADLERVFKSPVVTAEEKKRVLGKVLTKLGTNATVTNFCLLLADKNRLSSLRAIAKVYSDLLNTEKGIVRGHLTTAINLDTKKKNSIKKQLEDKAKKSIDLTFEVDKSILGGLVLKVGDRVLDASLRAQLAVLRETIKRGE